MIALAQKHPQSYLQALPVGSGRTEARARRHPRAPRRPAVIFSSADFPLWGTLHTAGDTVGLLSEGLWKVLKILSSHFQVGFGDFGPTLNLRFFNGVVTWL